MRNSITIQSIAEAIRTKRPDLTVEISNTIKNRQTLQGLTIKSPSVNIAPNIYVDAYIEKFDDIDSIASAILNTYEEHKCLNNFNVSDILNRDFILEHITLVMQQESDEPLIKLPNVSERFPGAEAYLAIAGTETDGAFSIKLNPQILASAGLDIKENNLFERAIENIRASVEIKSMFETLKQMIDLPDGCDEPSPFPENMYVATNKSKVKGASVILCEDVLYNFAKEHNLLDKGYHIIGSSVHECLFVFGDNLDIDSLSDMIRSVNETQLDPIDILTNQAWFYSPSKN